VIGEEFGLISCIAVALVYLAIIVRVLLKLLDEDNIFILLAAAGLTVQFGMQAIINMGVNAQIFPSKGMTLPLSAMAAPLCWRSVSALGCCSPSPGGIPIWMASPARQRRIGVADERYPSLRSRRRRDRGGT
jgi:hypothetical protein